MKTQTILLLTLLLTACSTATKSTLLGAGIGFAAGALVGNAAGFSGDPDNLGRSTVIGGAVGGGLGALIGYHAYQQSEKNNTKVPIPKIEGFGKAPSLTAPEVRRVWIPDKIDGNKYEAGHYIYIIERSSLWSK